MAERNVAIAPGREYRRSIHHDNPAMVNDEEDKAGSNGRTEENHQSTPDDDRFSLFSTDSIAQKEQHNAKVVKAYGFLPRRAPTIRDGYQLPDRFEPVPSFFLGKPIEEIENGISEATFCVLSPKFRKTYVHRFAATKSCFAFSPWNPIRKLCVAVVSSQYFEYFMMFTIFSNFIFHMCEKDYDIPEIVRLVFLIVYILEMFIKSIAYGFAFGKCTYLRYSWNWLDFVCNIESCLSMFVDSGSADVLRMFRLFRILHNFKGYAPILDAINRFKRMLFEIMLLAIFCLTIFALIGVQVYAGTFRNKCVEHDHLIETNGSKEKDAHRPETFNFFNPWEVPIDFEYHTCGNVSGTIHCGENATCYQDARMSPNYGYTNFDNFGSAMLTTFQIMSLNSWNQVYNEIIYSTGPFGIVFFILVIFVGNFYVLNLILAALVFCCRRNTKYQESIPKKCGLDATMEETIVNGNKSRQGLVADAQDLPDHNCACCATCCCCWRYTLWLRFQRGVERLVTNCFVHYFIVGCIIGNTLLMALDHHNKPAWMEQVLKQANMVFLLIYVIELTMKLICWSRDFFKDSWNTFDFIIITLSVLEFVLENVSGISVFRALRLFRLLRLSRASCTTQANTPMNVLRLVVAKTLDVLEKIMILLFISAFIFGGFANEMISSPLTDPDIVNTTFSSRLKPLGRLHFLTTTHSVFLIFRIMFGDWVEPLTQTMAWAGHAGMHFIFPALILGKFVILTAMLALIITAFESEERTIGNKQDQAPSRLTQGWQWIKNNVYACCNSPLLSPVPGEETNLRRRVNRVVNHRFFEWNIFLLVLVNSITLCLEDVSLQDSHERATAVQVLNSIFCAVYLLEMILKLTGHGFYSYFSSGSTILEFIVAISSLLNVSLPDHKDCSILRALVPIRMISSWKAIQIIGTIFVSTIPHILYVTIISSIFWTIFAILGVQMFAGKFDYCVDDDFEQVNHTIVPDIVHCGIMNFTWLKASLNFDNVVYGYVTLLQVATFQNWEQVTARAADSTLVFEQPVEDTSLYVYWYFFIFLLCGAFYPLFLFIGIIIENFNKLAKKHEGGVMNVFLSERWGKYLSAMQTPDGKPWHRPSSKVQAFCYDLATNLRFEIFMFVIILLNMICLVLLSYGVSPHLLLGLELMNLVITFVLIVEAVVKIAGMRRLYFKEAWNIFDFIIAIFGVVDFITEFLLLELGVNSLAFARIFRVLRLIRLFRIYRIRSVENALNGKLLSVITRSLPAHFTLTVLLFLVMFIYSIMGTLLFSHIKHTDILNEFTNFETAHNSVILLFRLFTSGWWYDTLEALRLPLPYCGTIHDDNGTNCGKPFLAVLFLASYIILNFMIVTIYTAVILHNFKEVHQQLDVTADDVDTFFVTWTKYDPHATQFISLWELPNFIHNLDLPLRIARPNGAIIVSFNLPIARGTRVHCMDVLNSLVRNRMVNSLVGGESEDFVEVQELTERMCKKYFAIRNHLDLDSASQEWDETELTQRLDQNASQQPQGSVKMEAEIQIEL